MIFVLNNILLFAFKELKNNNVFLAHLSFFFKDANMKLISILLILLLMMMAEIGFVFGNRYPGPARHNGHGLNLEERHRVEETNRFDKSIFFVDL